MRTSTMVAIFIAAAVIFVSAEVIRSKDHSSAPDSSDPKPHRADRVPPLTGVTLFKSRWSQDDLEWQRAVEAVEGYGFDKFEHMAQTERPSTDPYGFVTYPWRLTAKAQLDAILRACAELESACLGPPVVALAPCDTVRSDPTCEGVPKADRIHYWKWLKTKAIIRDPVKLTGLRGVESYLSPPEYNQGALASQAVRLPPPPQIKPGYRIGPLTVVRRCDPGVMEGLCLVIELVEPMAAQEELNLYERDHCGFVLEYVRGFCGERGRYTVIELL